MAWLFLFKYHSFQVTMELNHVLPNRILVVETGGLWRAFAYRLSPHPLGTEATLCGIQSPCVCLFLLCLSQGHPATCAWRAKTQGMLFALLWVLPGTTLGQRKERIFFVIYLQTGHLFAMFPICAIGKSSFLVCTMTCHF